MKKIKVLIIEDSISVREILAHIIREDPRLEVLAEFSNAEDALKFMDEHEVDVISLDIRLPGMNGLEATHRIMSTHPTPIVVIANNLEKDELQIPMNALRAGALCVLNKPVGLSHRDYDKYADDICSQLVAMSTVKVVRQRFARKLAFTPKASPKEVEALQSPVQTSPASRSPSLARDRLNPSQFKMLAVVSSTGGPSALVQLFQALPKNFPLPIVLVQHITSCFLQSFAEWLSSNTPFKVNIAYSGEIPRPGTIYMAPPDHHLEVSGQHLKLSRSSPICCQRPSGTVLLRSMAHSLLDKSIGVILTGMGSDGADGLLEVRKVGGYTIAEDETTAVIYGMPAAAVELGAACEILPLDKIAPHILELLNYGGFKA